MKDVKTNEMNGFFIHLFQTLLVLLLISIFILCAGRKFDQDEIEAVHTSWKILNGERIFVDFFQHHHPFFYYCISPVIYFVGESTDTLVTLRVIMYSLFIGMLVISFCLTELIFKSKYVSWLTILLMCCMTMFSRKAIEIRPDVPQVLFALIAIYCIFKYNLIQKKVLLFISSFCMALSFLFLQKTLFIIAGIGILQLYWIYSNKLKVSCLIQYWGLFICFISPYYIWLLANNQFDNYLLFNWILNMNFEGAFSPFKTILDSFYYNHLIWVCYIIGLVVCYKKRVVDIPLLSILLFGSVFLVRAPYRQYFMPFIPFMCMVVAYGINILMNYKLGLTVVVCIFIVPVVYNMLTVLNYPNKDQLEKMEWVLNTTSKYDRVYDGRTEFNLFRSDIDYFWFSTEPRKGGLQSFQKLKPYKYNIYENIERYKPSIVSDAFIDDFNHPAIHGVYERSAEYKNFLIRVR